MYRAFGKQWINSMRGHHVGEEFQKEKKKRKNGWANYEYKIKKNNETKDDTQSLNEKWPLSTNRFYI